MTVNRDSQICLEATSYYHCYVRCVRRAFLCGDDYLSGQNYDHRKQWIVSRLKFLSYIYAIDICAYAVMSNHYHVVLHVDRDRALAWADEEVVERWLQLYKAPVLIQRWQVDKAGMDEASLAKVDEIIQGWRLRLYDISWFMRGVNETIARMANDEEDCKGRFWEGRFKSQALLDESALLSCMAYVDLNPVRAAMAEDLAGSDFTSVQQRLYDHLNDKSSNPNDEEPQLLERINKQQGLKEVLDVDKQLEAPLMSFDGSCHTDIHAALPFTREDYFQLVDETGRCLRSDKRGAISEHSRPIIQRLGINPDEWLKHIKHFGRTYGRSVGSVHDIKEYSTRFNRQWGKGVGAAKILYV